MFKDLGLIESWGTGIGKAKRTLLDNGSPELHFEEFPEDVDIASVSIPINKEYLALEGELFIGGEKMNIGAENMNINVQINSIKGRIEALSAAPRQKESLLKLVEPLFGKAFGRREVLMILGCAVATGAKYVAILESGGLIEPVQGLGKGKYRFAVKRLLAKQAAEKSTMKDSFAEIKLFQVKPEKTEQFETLIERMSAD